MRVCGVLFDFSNYMLNGLKIENLTQDILLGPTFNLLKGTCSSTSSSTNLKTSDPEVTYTSSIMKTKEARYEIKGIEDMVPTLWSTIKHAYDKDAKKGIKHWGERHKLWYRSQVSKFSKHNVYSTKAILGVKSVSDFVDLHLNDIEDMLLLAIQHKLFHLDGNVTVDFIVALRMFIRSLILKRRVKDLQLGDMSDEDLDKQKRVLRAGELYKFSDGTLKSVRDEIHHRVLDFRLDYNTKIPKRKWMVVD
ncbi:hypothetical protein Tco_1312808 [Tanacetum coccineum]